MELRETGLATNTGGRIQSPARGIGNERFILTWGDGVWRCGPRRAAVFHRRMEGW